MQFFPTYIRKSFRLWDALIIKTHAIDFNSLKFELQQQRFYFFFHVQVTWQLIIDFVVFCST